MSNPIGFPYKLYKPILREGTAVQLAKDKDKRHMLFRLHTHRQCLGTLLLSEVSGNFCSKSPCSLKTNAVIKLASSWSVVFVVMVGLRMAIKYPSAAKTYAQDSFSGSV